MERIKIIYTSLAFSQTKLSASEHGALETSNPEMTEHARSLEPVETQHAAPALSHAIDTKTLLVSVETRAMAPPRLTQTLLG